MGSVLVGVKSGYGIDGSRVVPVVHLSLRSAWPTSLQR